MYKRLIPEEKSVKKEKPPNADHFPPMKINLDQNWLFTQAGSGEWLPAEAPGSVHTDLLKNGRIKDPYYRLEEHDAQWIDKTDWEYQTDFYVEEELLKKDRVEILFTGLDTQADVYLNDNLILKAGNMFRQWRLDVKNLLSDGLNQLRIYFHSPVKVGLEKYDNLDYKIPVSQNDLSEIGGLGKKRVSVHLRKAGYHFGWDWGPRLTTSGIWRPVFLIGWNRAIIRNTHVRQVSLQDAEARIEIAVEIESLSDFRAGLRILIDGKPKTITSLDVREGVHTHTIPLLIARPERWQPNGAGDQKLYDIAIQLSSGETIISDDSVRTGFRAIEVVREADSDGKSFFFKVNERPLFMKGANYIPQDVFLSRVPPDRYRHVIRSAAKANMNMVRVWGGGVYEQELFYDLCDEYGILVWQDFMFACAMYPGEDDFTDNIKQEAEENIRRLRNHPCIALWCGNNECVSAWHLWDWKNRIPVKQSPHVAEKLWKDYEMIFHHILPEAVKRLDPDRFYWASSPQSEEGEPESYHSGDAHYWGVWWNKEPFENYLKNIPRFMSEYGFQSFPALKSIRKFAREKDWDIYSDVMQSHQRSIIGNETIETYLLQYYQPPKNFPMLLYAGQVLQAEGIKTAIEAHRRNMPYCMGSLFWQLNDCWPAASWSSIDYYGEWKALHYFAAKAFAPVLISPVREEGSIRLFAVSDLSANVRANLEATLLDFQGEKLWKHSDAVVLESNVSKCCFTLDEKALQLNDPAKILLHVKLIGKNGDALAENTLYFTEPKNLDLSDPALKYELTPVSNGCEIALSAQKMAKNVFLSTSAEGFFSDNYFDLLPGSSRKILFSSNDKSSPEKDLEILSLRDTFAV